MTGYRIFLERKTLGGLPWRVETADGFTDCHDFYIHGNCRSRHDEGREKPFAVSGTGRITSTNIDGHITVDIWDSEA